MKYLYTALLIFLQTYYIQHELLDERETRYIFRIESNKLEGLKSFKEFRETINDDLAMLQKRTVDLMDAPYLSDCHRLPKRDTVNDWLVFNKQYEQHLENCLATELRPKVQHEIKEVLRETRYCYKVYDLFRDATVNYYYVSVRRASLKQLVELVGDEAYYSGDFPPPYPYWRFEQIH